MATNGFGVEEDDKDKYEPVPAPVLNEFGAAIDPTTGGPASGSQTVLPSGGSAGTVAPRGPDRNIAKGAVTSRFSGPNAREWVNKEKAAGGRIGVENASNLRDIAGGLTGRGETYGGMAEDITGRAMDAPVTNFDAANARYNKAVRDAETLRSIEAVEGPSAAQAVMQSGLNRAQQSSLALARSGSGWGSSASAMDTALAENAGLSQEGVNAAAALRAQENAAWRQRQAGNIGAAAGIDVTVGGAREGQSKFDTEAGLKAEQIRYGAGAAFGGLDVGARSAATMPEVAAGQAEFQGQQVRIDLEKTLLQNDQFLISDETQRYGIDKGVAIQNAAAKAQERAATVSAVTSLIAVAAMAASDERAKKNITPADAEQTVKALEAVTFDYKDPGKHGEGRKTGFIAQDMEKTPAGRRAVYEAGDGTKMFRGAEVAAIAIADLVNVHRELDELKRMVRHG